MMTIEQQALALVNEVTQVTEYKIKEPTP